MSGRAHRVWARPMALLVIGAVAIGTITGCTQTSPPSPSVSATADPTRSATASPSPSVSTLDEAEDVEDALPFFTDAVMAVWATDARYQGRAYIEALVAAGFSQSRMEVTEDLTTLGSAADSIQFSVRWGDDCLVGQAGPVIGDPVIAVLPGLATGGCLLGQTRPIDW